MAEPSNLLVRLKIANLQERHAGVVEDETDRAVARADALEQYLGIAKMQPGLVEARYRASVLAGMLASTAETVVATRQPVCDELKLLAVTADALGDTLRGSPSWSRRRSSSCFGPGTRSCARRACAISSSSRASIAGSCGARPHLQTLPAGAQAWSGHVSHGALRTLVAAPRRSLRYMAFGGSWQAHYNAANFYALLYTRARALEDDAPSAFRLAGRH